MGGGAYRLGACARGSPVFFFSPERGSRRRIGRGGGWGWEGGLEEGVEGCGRVRAQLVKTTREKRLPVRLVRLLVGLPPTTNSYPVSCVLCMRVSVCVCVCDLRP